MPTPDPSHLDLQATAKEIMQQYGFHPDFPPEVGKQLADLKTHPREINSGGEVRDLRQHVVVVDR